MNLKLYKIMKDVYAEFTGDELADVIKAIRREIELEKAEKELNSKIIHFTKELGIIRDQREKN